MLKPLRQTQCDSFSEITKQINILRSAVNDLATVLGEITAAPTPEPIPEPVKTKTKTSRKEG